MLPFRVRRKAKRYSNAVGFGCISSSNKERLLLCPVGVGNHDRLCGNRKTSVNHFGNVCYQQQ